MKSERITIDVEPSFRRAFRKALPRDATQAAACRRAIEAYHKYLQFRRTYSGAGAILEFEDYILAGIKAVHPSIEAKARQHKDMEQVG